jgi:hypothetical protein
MAYHRSMIRRRSPAKVIRADVHVRFLEAMERVRVREVEDAKEEVRALERAAARTALEGLPSKRRPASIVLGPRRPAASA